MLWRSSVIPARSPAVSKDNHPGDQWPPLNSRCGMMLTCARCRRPERIAGGQTPYSLLICLVRLLQCMPESNREQRPPLLCMDAWESTVIPGPCIDRVRLCAISERWVRAQHRGADEVRRKGHPETRSTHSFIVWRCCAHRFVSCCRGNKCRTFIVSSWACWLDQRLPPRRTSSRCFRSPPGQLDSS